MKANPATPAPCRRIIANIVGLIAVFSIVASLVLIRDGKLFGHKFISAEPEATPTVMQTAGGAVVTTTEIGKDVIGYGGPVPVNIYISGGKIDSVAPLPNDETPRFFERVADAGLFNSWDGLTVEEAAAKKVDAVTGATYTSKAAIENVRLGLNAYSEAAVADADESTDGYTQFKLICSLIVALAAAILPLRIRNKRYLNIQKYLNVFILGFWGGIFVDYSMLLNVFSNGFKFSLAGLLIVVLLIVAFIYPLFNKAGYYCANVCPFGSMQDLAIQNGMKKIRLTPGAAKALSYLPDIVWAVLIACLWLGFFTQWVDYEIFTAFIIKSAAWSVIGVGIGFLILSFFIGRPFCRFVCPVGTLLRKSQNINNL